MEQARAPKRLGAGVGGPRQVKLSLLEIPGADATMGYGAQQVSIFCEMRLATTFRRLPEHVALR